MTGFVILIIVVTLAIPLLAFGFLGWMLVRSRRKAHASEHWPTTSGRILTSTVSSHRSLNSNGTHTTIYEPKIVYEYVVNGQRYQSEQINFSMIAGTSGGGYAETLVDKYPEGSIVPVFYNPQNPTEAVLEH
ncbi:MAG TPA: DUF3592 domain-containing protein [Phototrophicaceae bacterium]|nr:DUF3592 domain-containing protein [Phototrophicaceae bacterium]